MEFFACSEDQAYSMGMDNRDPGRLRREGLIGPPLTAEQIQEAHERGVRREQLEIAESNARITKGIALFVGALLVDCLTSRR
jgi:hypothetical protein